MTQRTDRLKLVSQVSSGTYQPNPDLLAWLHDHSEIWPNASTVTKFELSHEYPAKITAAL